MTNNLPIEFPTTYAGAWTLAATLREHGTPACLIEHYISSALTLDNAEGDLRRSLGALEMSTEQAKAAVGFGHEIDPGFILGNARKVRDAAQARSAGARAVQAAIYLIKNV